MIVCSSSRGVVSASAFWSIMASRVLTISSHVLARNRVSGGGVSMQTTSATEDAEWAARDLESRAGLEGMSRTSAQALRGKPLAASATNVVDSDLVQKNGGLKEFSVVYTDRALNHMSEPFCNVMKDLSAGLKRAYNADHCVLVPGSGTYGMEAVAHQFGSGGRKVLVVRNGYFSYRWSAIFESLRNENVTVLKARPIDAAGAYAPPPIDEVVEAIFSEKPALVCAPHVETSVGIILPTDYIMKVAAAAHEVGAVFCIDGIASGSAWLDLGVSGVDVYLTAPQKGWTGPACAGIVMMSERAKEMMKAGPPSTSFACNLLAWHNVMDTYVNGRFAYHCTMPTDALRTFRDVFYETEAFGLKKCEAECWRLGNGVREIFKKHGFQSVAADGFEAPGVVVVFAKDATYATKFKAVGMQIAPGVPFMLDEPAGTATFRIGLFGLDKLQNVETILAAFEEGLVNVMLA